MQETMKVVSSARKLAIRPLKDAPIVTFPEGAKINNWGVNNTTPTIVVRNGSEKEPSWQGVSFETGVVLINEVDEGYAELVLDALEIGEPVQDVLHLLEKLGFVDQYTANNEYVATKLSPAGRMIGPDTGIMKRDDRDLFEVYREGDTFYVVHKNGPRIIEPDILVRTYRNPDGTAINLDSVPYKVTQ